MKRVNRSQLLVPPLGVCAAIHRHQADAVLFGQKLLHRGLDLGGVHVLEVVLEVVLQVLVDGAAEGARDLEVRGRGDAGLARLERRLKRQVSAADDGSAEAGIIHVDLEARQRGIQRVRVAQGHGHDRGIHVRRIRGDDAIGLLGHVVEADDQLRVDLEARSVHDGRRGKCGSLAGREKRQSREKQGCLLHGASSDQD